MTNAVMILPAAYLDAGNAFGVAQGWGEGNFSVPLSASGIAPATHWGCCAEVGPGFLAMMASPPAEAAPLVAVMVSSFDDARMPFDHWSDVLAANGLVRVADNA